MENIAYLECKYWPFFSLSMSMIIWMSKNFLIFAFICTSPVCIKNGDVENLQKCEILKRYI